VAVPAAEAAGVAPRIRALRLRLGLSQEQFARRLGVSFATVNRWESGRTAISARMEAAVQRLAGESAPSPPRGVDSSFVGRTSELAELLALSRGHRLICLIGPGGLGKTRLAAALADRLDRPCTTVELGSVRGPEQVTSAIAAALQIRDRPDAPARTLLVEALQGGPKILVLDACEHVRREVCVVVAALLEGVPELTIIVTSRGVLGASGELSWAVPPLTLPDDSGMGSSDAVELFAARARTHLPGFDLGAVDTGVVGELCHRLGGSPLAIELITGWIGTLSIEEILTQRVSLLGGRPGRGADSGGLRAVIEASYELLEADERALLAELSVFAAPFTVDDACAVTTIPAASLVHFVRGLVDSSWLQVRRDGLHNRFVLLETTREFAAEQLTQRDLVQERHCRYFSALAVASEDGLTTADAVQWRGRMAAAWPDVERALHWAKVNDERELGLTASAALWRWWLTTGRLIEGRAWLAQLLEMPGESQSLADGRALASSAVLATENGDYPSAVEQGGAALRIFTALDEHEPMAFAATIVGSAHRYLGDHRSAREQFEQAMVLRRELGDQRGVSVGLNNLALLALDQGELADARELFEESLLLKRQLGEPRAVAIGLTNLAEVLLRSRHLERAAHAIDEAVALAEELGDRQLLGNLRCNQGELEQQRGDFVAAARRYAEAAEAHGAAGHHHDVVVALVGQGRCLHRLGRTREAVTKLRTAEALAAKIANVSHLATVRRALAEIGELTERSPVAGVTAREAEILGFLGRGMTNKEIAAELGLSVSTVERHLATSYRKLQLRGRVEAARFALAHGLAPPPR
jgi:predicted ATPase/DNA-binding CsgD family transcriptional regulator/DNA-binding XRE family transcriptional regulator